MVLELTPFLASNTWVGSEVTASLAVWLIQIISLFLNILTHLYNSLTLLDL
jgi:hypothetical protein